MYARMRAESAIYAINLPLPLLQKIPASRNSLEIIAKLKGPQTVTLEELLSAFQHTCCMFAFQHILRCIPPQSISIDSTDMGGYRKAGMISTDQRRDIPILAHGGINKRT